MKDILFEYFWRERKMKNWLYREVPEKLEPAKGIINGVILGSICWIAIIVVVMLCYY